MLVERFHAGAHYAPRNVASLVAALSQPPDAAWDAAGFLRQFDAKRIMAECAEKCSRRRRCRAKKCNLHVIAAGSLLGLEYRDDEEDRPVADDDAETTGFPVGKVDTIGVHPLSFVEFLSALGEGALADEICRRNWDTVEMFWERLVDLLKHYYVIGGMPEAVAAYVETHNFIDAIDVQKSILSDYRNDFAKHAPKNDVPRIKMFWDAIPSQLAKENKKFMYSGIRKGERAAWIDHRFRDRMLETFSERVMKKLDYAFEASGEGDRVFTFVLVSK